jgi:hypothetical protein
VLRAGTALPQTGVDGTFLSFSVDFEFRDGGPDPSCRYVLVIERNNGGPFEAALPGGSSGNAVVLPVPWQPEDAPFKCHVDEIAPDGSRKRVSADAPLT